MELDDDGAGVGAAAKDDFKAPESRPGEFVTQWAYAGEQITRRKTARSSDASGKAELHVSDTHYAALTRDDISVLQMVFSLTWADLIDEGKSRPVFWDPFTLKLDFIPRVDIALPPHYNWAIFTRVYPTFNARGSRFFRDWLHEEIQAVTSKRATFCVLFWARCSQPDPVKSPGTLDFEFGLVEEGAQTHRERIECLSPVISVQNPSSLQYVLPYFRIEGRLTRD